MKDRIKPLKGIENFRDFGGYLTSDGAMVKPGLLYRTASMHAAEDDDVAFLNTLKIDFQVDLRRQSERQSQPNLWSPNEVHTYNDNQPSIPAHIEFLQKGNLTSADAHGFMESYYQMAPWVDSHVDLYQRWFKRLVETDGGGVINCAAGKDRTGLGCALTLHVLGVDEDTIFEDYILTNTAVNLHERLPRIREKWEARLETKIPEDDVLHPFLGVKAAYLHAAFREIKERHGSLSNYIESVLNVSSESVDKLKMKLLA